MKVRSVWVLDALILHLGLKAHRSLSSCRGLASSPCSPVCWGSVTCLHWETGTDGAPGTPSRPGSLAPQSCSGRRREREDAFALSIVPALCPLSGGCRTCGLWEMKKQWILTLPILAAEQLQPGTEPLKDTDFCRHVNRWSEREAEEKGWKINLLWRAKRASCHWKDLQIQGCNCSLLLLLVLDIIKAESLPAVWPRNPLCLKHGCVTF